MQTLESNFLWIAYLSPISKECEKFGDEYSVYNVRTNTCTSVYLTCARNARFESI